MKTKLMVQLLLMISTFANATPPDNGPAASNHEAGFSGYTNFLLCYLLLATLLIGALLLYGKVKAYGRKVANDKLKASAV